jgi:hypothetical protein
MSAQHAPGRILWFTYCVESMHVGLALAFRSLSSIQVSIRGGAGVGLGTTYLLGFLYAESNFQFSRLVVSAVRA